MEQDIKKEARRQYLKYFCVWFIIAGVLLVLGAVIFVGKMLSKQNTVRGNDEAPWERVYDYADVLTDEEEELLREYIAKREEEARIDIVLVTICEDVEAEGSWERVMMEYADDFYDNNKYGYNKVHGDGVLLLDNWYEGQGGSWLSTCGKVYEEFGDYEINRVLDAVYYDVEDNPYRAYRQYVDTVADYMSSGGAIMSLYIFGMFFVVGLIVSAVVALIYAAIHLHQKQAKVTTNSLTYVVGGKPVIREQRDDFIRKNVVTRRIETSSSSGSSGGRSGGGGGHRSSGGVRHGGGGRRR